MAMGFSRVLLVGNLTRAPEVQTLASGQLMTRLGMAVSRSWLDREGNRREDVSFFNLVAHARAAECLARYGRKSRRLFVDRRLAARTVTSSCGESRTLHEVVVEEFQSLDSAGTPLAEKDHRPILCQTAQREDEESEE